MNSDSKKVVKKKETLKKDKAFVDTSDSKIVKADKESNNDKAIVENMDIDNVTKPEFLKWLSALRDELHDFGQNMDEVNDATKTFYEEITGNIIEPTFDEDGEEETFELSGNWEDFKEYWDEIEKSAKELDIEKIRHIVKKHEVDINHNFNENFEQDLKNAISESIYKNYIKIESANKWLSENKYSDIINDINSVEDIINLISLYEKSESEPESKFDIGDTVYFIPKLSGMNKEKGLIIEFKKYEKPDSLLGEETDYDWYYSFKDSNLRAVESDLTDDIKLVEGKATEDDINMDNDNEEKGSSSTPEPANIKESIQDNESSSDDEEFDEDDSINEEEVEEENDILQEFKEMAKSAEDLDSFINAIRTKNDVTEEVSSAFYEKYGQDGNSPEQAAEILYNEVKGSMNENIHKNMKRLMHLNALKENANELVNKFGITDIDKIKKSLNEELTDKEYEIVLEDVNKALGIEVGNEYDETISMNESLRSDLYNKLL